MPSLSDLTGQVALVTGATGGLGAAIIHEMAVAGAALAVCDLKCGSLRSSSPEAAR